MGLGGAGNIKTLDDSYQFTVDVRDFSPEDIIVTTSNNQIEVRAEKVGRGVGGVETKGVNVSQINPNQASISTIHRMNL